MLVFAVTRYVGWTIATMIALFALAAVLQFILGIEMPTGASVVTAMVPAFAVGMGWFSRFSEVPSKLTAWKCAVLFTAIQVIFAAVLFALLMNIDPAISQLVSSMGPGFLSGTVTFVALLVLLVSRFSFRFGAKQAAKAAEK